MHSWKQSQTSLPCSAYLAGKMCKTKKTPAKPLTEAYNLAVTWSPGTENKAVTSNEVVALDWGIINIKAHAKVNNVFAVYLETNTGFVFTNRYMFIEKDEDLLELQFERRRPS
jgi:hypothetical protein